MHRRLAGSLCVVCLLASGCIVRKDKQPSVDVGLSLPSKFVHRGMTLVDKPVFKPSLAVGLPVTTGEGDSIGITVDGALETSNGTGNAWFPDGHAGRFTQFEVIADYSRKIGDVSLRGGIHNYNLPNGVEFISGSPAGSERGGTSEIFLLASMEVLETTPYASWNYDFDEVRASYFRAGLTEGFDLGKGFSLALDGSLGYVGSGQALWMYGLPESGLADLRGEAVLNYQYDERTTLEFGLHGSTIVNSTLDDWFSLLGIADDVIWVSVGVTWSF